jgi:uncharacterized protein YbjT (DUF2867 family)
VTYSKDVHHTKIVYLNGAFPMNERPSVIEKGEIHAVTGAFGYAGRYIAGRLLDKGCRVITLTNSVHRENPFEGRIKAYPYNFDNPDKLKESLEGVRVLYNTYWVRFNSSTFTFASALNHSRTLFETARKAGVKRILHTSITNPSSDSPYEYFSGKAKVESALKESGLSYAILRPALLFGRESILINNIAWILRSFPVFAVFGPGTYRMQPIYVDDFAGLAVEQGERTENVTMDAIGPETFTYRGLVEKLGGIIGKERPILSVPPTLGYMASKIIGKVVGDVLVTRDEIRGLIDELLCVESPPTGKTRLTDWARDHASFLGRRYQSELARRHDRVSRYV